MESGKVLMMTSHSHFVATIPGFLIYAGIQANREHRGRKIEFREPSEPHAFLPAQPCIVVQPNPASSSFASPTPSYHPSSMPSYQPNPALSFFVSTTSSSFEHGGACTKNSLILWLKNLMTSSPTVLIHDGGLICALMTLLLSTKKKPKKFQCS